jgi:hypothetical protein
MRLGVCVRVCLYEVHVVMNLYVWRRGTLLQGLLKLVCGKIQPAKYLTGYAMFLGIPNFILLSELDFRLLLKLMGSLESVVGIATGYGLDDRVVGVRVPVGSRIFSSRRPNRLSGPLSILSNAYRRLFPRG